MKVVFDTNVYISWIREGKYPDLLLNPYTIKYITSATLMELWTGARTKNGIQIVEKLQNIYLKTNRVINLTTAHYITIGKILSEMPIELKSKIQTASFLNDLQIGLSVYSIGATLYTENKSDFKIIEQYLKDIKINYL